VLGTLKSGGGALMVLGFFTGGPWLIAVGGLMDAGAYLAGLIRPARRKVGQDGVASADRQPASYRPSVSLPGRAAGTSIQVQLGGSVARSTTPTQGSEPS